MILMAGGECTMEENIYHLQYALDTFYFLVCGALVMWMAAGFSMLEAGLVRAKNTTGILTKNIALYGIACLMYLSFGYALMYDGNFFLNHIALDGAQNAGSLVTSVLGEFAARAADPNTGFNGPAIYANGADFFFQVVFVATAMSIVSGAVAERMKLWSFLLFATVMTGFIYPMEGAWAWGGKAVFGLYSLADLGFADVAGSGVVHLAGASAALAGVILLGPRMGKYGARGQIHAIPGANLPMATLGTFILWLGWFGFNGGSVLKLSDIGHANTVAMVFLNTNTAAAGGLVAALLVARLLFGKADLTMALNGALAGLVAITAGPIAPSPLAAMLLGAVAGILVVVAIIGLDKLKLDDPVGAISVHGVVGFFGLMVVPFSDAKVSFSGQFIGALTIFTWVFVLSLATWALLKWSLGLRVPLEEEYAGVDLSECGMEAYPEFTRQ